jgi:outer membrane protein
MKTKVILILCFLPALLMGQEARWLSLQNAIDSALQNNYGIIIQQINADIAVEQNSWGAAGALPGISFVGAASESFAFNDLDQSETTNLNASVDLNWTIFRGFSAKISKAKLDELEKLAGGNLDILVENTLIGVMNTYYQSLLNQEYIRIGEELTALSKDRFTYEEEKTRLGVSGTYDLLQAKNAFLEDQSMLLSSKATYRASIRQLNYMMGVNLDQEYVLIEAFEPNEEHYALKVLEEKMMSNNHTLQNQYLNLKMAELDVRQAKSGYYPTISVGASGGYGSTNTAYDINNSLDNSMSNWNSTVSASLSYSIYNGGVRKQGLQVARLQEEITNVQTRDMEQEMKMTLRQELDFYQVRQEQLALAEENAEAAMLNMELSRERYENGTINSFNYRDVQQMYLNAAVQYQNAKFSVIESYNAILRLTGGIIDELGSSFYFSTQFS